MTGALRRLPHYLILIAAMVALNFFLPRMMPGSPATRLASDSGYAVTAEEREQILGFYNLDKPMGEQFAMFLEDLVTLDWGRSFSKKQPIFDLIKAALPWTLLLAVCNIAIASVIGTFLGALSAFMRKRGRDKPLVIGMMALSAMPAFWIGMMLLSVFGVRLGWFPLFGAYSMWGDYTGMAYVADVLRHLAMPLATSVLASLAAFFTTARYGVLNTMEHDYIRMARMRGVPDARVKTFYIMRNGFIPVFVVLMTQMGFILSGSLVIEKIFTYPGLGLLLADAVVARDYPLMQYAFLMTSIMVAITMFLADVLHYKLDPALGSDGGSEKHGGHR
ncbi:MAG: ABC transporter permease [Clostridiales bacterium]|nr:ABC transporter permease [Clostridiales bacterium]